MSLQSVKIYLIDDGNYRRIATHVLFRLGSIIAYILSMYFFVQKCSLELYGELVVGLTLYIVLIPVEALINFFSAHRYNESLHKGWHASQAIIKSVLNLTIILGLMVALMQTVLVLFVGFNMLYIPLYVGVILSSPIILLSSMMNAVLQVEGNFLVPGVSRILLDIAKGLGIVGSAIFYGNARYAGIIILGLVLIKTMLEIWYFSRQKKKAFHLKFNNLKADFQILYDSLPVLYSAIVSLGFQYLDKMFAASLFGKSGLALYCICLDLVTKVYPIAQLPSGIVSTYMISNKGSPSKVKASLLFLITFSLVIAGLYYFVILIGLKYSGVTRIKDVDVSAFYGGVCIMSVGGVVYTIGSAFEVFLAAHQLVKITVFSQVIALFVYIIFVAIGIKPLGLYALCCGYSLFMITMVVANILRYSTQVYKKNG